MSQYNGWTNWETWQILLWSDNHPATYEATQDFVRSTIITAHRVEEFFRQMFPYGTPDMDGQHEMERVNWDEIAEHLADESRI